MTGKTQITISTSGEKFYEVTDQITDALRQITKSVNKSGILHIFNLHTSCALCISESFAHSAKLDLENFLKCLAPRNAGFIVHTDEGDDDSPSHMKSILLNQNLTLAVEENKLVLGSWQGIFLAEFRDRPHQRRLMLKYIPD